jgi:hypothetical protein
MPGETVASALPWRQAGCSPRRASPFFCFAKIRNQEKATPTVAPRCAGSPRRRALKRGAPELAPLRCAQTDAAPDPLQGPAARRHRRGPHVKSNRNDNDNCNCNCNDNDNDNDNCYGKVCAGNALAVVQQALQTEHGAEAVTELSYYAMVLEIAQIWPGMAIVMPTRKWNFIRHRTPGDFTAWLLYVARHVHMDRFRRSRRGPKKRPSKQPMDKKKLQFHVCNKRLIDETKTH